MSVLQENDKMNNACGKERKRKREKEGRKDESRREEEKTEEKRGIH